jgi:hypothetical protein
MVPYGYMFEDFYLRGKELLSLLYSLDQQQYSFNLVSNPLVL